MAGPGFPSISSTVAPPPTAFTTANCHAPFPTNEPWQNFVLNSGTVPELVLPYSTSVQNTGLAFGWPEISDSGQLVAQGLSPDLVLSIVEPLPVRQLSAYDKLSVTVTWGARLAAMLTRGSPYLTFRLSHASPCLSSSSHQILSLSAKPNKTEHLIKLSNGQTWAVFSSSPLDLSPDLTSSSPFSGVIRVALVPSGNPNVIDILSRYCSVYPLGCDVTVQQLSLSYRWKTESWDRRSGDELLMLTLPVHRAVLHGTGFNKEAASLSYNTLDGSAMGHIGAKWVLVLDGRNMGWHSRKGFRNAKDKEAVQSALVKDVAALTPLTEMTSTYFFGKAAARAARLGIIAEEVGMSDEASCVRQFLRHNLTPWFTGTVAGNALLYDSVWGGIVSKAGATDMFGDFGLAVYNDHHFHYGYFLYAAAVLAKLDPVWGVTYKAQIYALVSDFMTLNSNDPYFPQLRHFDPYALHSWASGLTEFADGRNQESTSEAVNAYYAASLVGFVFADLELANAAATLAGFEALSSKILWHVSTKSTFYPPAFKAESRVVGVLWATKRDAGLWFAPAMDFKKRLGIQVLPVTPYTEILFTDASYAKELVDWAKPVADSDAWNEYLYAIQAIYDRDGAILKINALQSFNDGDSLSNLLWWAYTR